MKQVSFENRGCSIFIYVTCIWRTNKYICWVKVFILRYVYFHKKLISVNNIFSSLFFIKLWNSCFRWDCKKFNIQSVKCATKYLMESDEVEKVFKFNEWSLLEWKFNKIVQFKSYPTKTNNQVLQNLLYFIFSRVIISINFFFMVFTKVPRNFAIVTHQ